MSGSIFKLVAIGAVLAGTSVPLRADEVTDALEAAMDAYAAGDLAGTSTAMAMAGQAIATRQSALLQAQLPPAPNGWTAEVSEGFAAGFGMMGGGAGVEMRYANADGSVSFTVTLLADNPMVASMGAMLGNAQMMALMGKVVKVGDQAILDSENTLNTLAGNRVLFTAQGATTAEMMPVVSLIDFAKLGTFDAK